jgi:hypothetical protein
MDEQLAAYERMLDEYDKIQTTPAASDEELARQLEQLGSFNRATLEFLKTIDQ